VSGVVAGSGTFADRESKVIVVNFPTAGFYTVSVGLPAQVAGQVESDCSSVPGERGISAYKSRFVFGGMTVKPATDNSGAIVLRGDTTFDDSGLQVRRTYAVEATLRPYQPGRRYAQIPDSVNQLVRRVRNAPEHGTMLALDTRAAEDSARERARIHAAWHATSPIKFVDVISQASGPCALATTGELYCWGVADPGPWRVDTPLRFTRVWSGRNLCGQTRSNEYYCRGDLVREQSTNLNAPPPMFKRLSDGPPFRDITVGGTHMCGLTADGAAWCWGRKDSGIGDGTTEARALPTAVVGGYTFASLSAGGGHTCGLTPDGRALCWGVNLLGQLGDGTSTTRTRPTAVVGQLRFRTIRADGNQTCGVTIDGKMYCWGLSQRDGGRPELVASSRRYVSVHGTEAEICAITNAGEADCWSVWNRNEHRSDPDSPVPLTSITLGMGYGCAVTVNRDALCWGHWKRDRDDAAPGLIMPGISDAPQLYSALRQRLSASQYTVSRAVTVDFLRMLADKELSKAEVLEALQTVVAKHARDWPPAPREVLHAAAFMRAYLTLQGTSSNVELDAVDSEVLQRLMDNKSQLEQMISNIMKAAFEGGQAAISALKAS